MRRLSVLLLALVVLTACRGDQGPHRAVTMYFVPSQNPATVRERTAVLERFMAEMAARLAAAVSRFSG